MAMTMPVQDVKERPIIFGQWKVGRILTWDFDARGDMQTRRTRGLNKINADREAWRYDGMNVNGDHLFYDVHAAVTGHDPQDCTYIVKCPYGKPGDRLWVKELWCDLSVDGDEVSVVRSECEELARDAFKWQTPLFMPRWASRTVLELTDVYAERLQDVSYDGARAEGLESVAQLGILRCSGWRDYTGQTVGFMNYADSLRTLWDELNAKRGFPFDSNPWVFVFSFKRVQPDTQP